MSEAEWKTIELEDVKDTTGFIIIPASDEVGKYITPGPLQLFPSKEIAQRVVEALYGRGAAKIGDLSIRPAKLTHYRKIEVESPEEKLTSSLILL